MTENTMSTENTTVVANSENTKKEEYKMTEKMFLESVKEIASGNEVTDEVKEAILAYVNARLEKKQEEAEMKAILRENEEKDVLDFLVEEEEYFTIAEMRKNGLDYSSPKAAAILKRLIEKGVVESIEEKRVKKYRVKKQ